MPRTRVNAARWALIGYAGAPWTIATYMVEGRGGGASEHGIVKTTRPEHVTALAEQVRSFTSHAPPGQSQ